MAVTRTWVENGKTYREWKERTKCIEGRHGTIVRTFRIVYDVVHMKNGKWTAVHFDTEAQALRYRREHNLLHINAEEACYLQSQELKEEIIWDK